MELLVASALGLVVILAGIQLLRTHAALALQVQADLGASSGAVWALRTALRDVKRAGADPLQRGLPAVATAHPSAFALTRDADSDGAIDVRSEESVGFAWSGRQGGRVARRVGAQSMAVVAEVPEGGLRLRYFDGRGRELSATGGLGDADRARVRRVEVDLEVVERIGHVSGRVLLSGGASVRVREGVR
ncbi:MAG: hypothetical protein P8R42_03395 [Candidatus Binatia bacterium]|nr:hypothetical protein [Candidatus Binatia bacterium]